MRTVTIKRIGTSDQGTFGILETDTGVEKRTLELPWRDNKQNESCIPKGTYQCEWLFSTRFGQCYHIMKVPNRADILFHPANFGGDTSKGFESDLSGCIALGEKITFLATPKGKGQKGLSASRIATKEFFEIMDHEPFMLTIVECF